MIRKVKSLSVRGVVTAAGTSPPVPRLCRLERWRSFRVGELSVLGGHAYSLPNQISVEIEGIVAVKA